MQKIIYTQTHNDKYYITLLHTQTHIVIHTNLSHTQQQLGDMYTLKGSIPTGDVEWCVLSSILDIYVGITIDKDRQYLMAVVDTGPMKCSPSIHILPIWIGPLPQQTDHLLCMAFTSSPIHLLIQRIAAIVEINNNHMNNNTVNNN